MPTEMTQRPPLLIFGAGGHARVVADALQQAHTDWPLTASDRNDRLCLGELLSGIPLATALACEYAGRGRDLPLAFNRKEAKAHGEGGSLIGAALAGRRAKASCTLSRSNCWL